MLKTEYTRRKMFITSSVETHSFMAKVGGRNKLWGKKLLASGSSCLFLHEDLPRHLDLGHLRSVLMETTGLICILWMLFPLWVPTKCGNSGVPESYACRGTVGSLLENVLQARWGITKEWRWARNGWKGWKRIITGTLELGLQQEAESQRDQTTVLHKTHVTYWTINHWAKQIFQTLKNIFPPT